MIRALHLRLAKLVAPIRLPAPRRAKKADLRITIGLCQRNVVEPIVPGSCTDRLQTVALAHPPVRHVRIPSPCPFGTYRAEFRTRIPPVRHWSATPQAVPLLVASRARFADPPVSTREYLCPPLSPLVSLLPKAQYSVGAPRITAVAVPIDDVNRMIRVDCSFLPIVRVDAHLEWLETASPPPPEPAQIRVLPPPPRRLGLGPVISRTIQGGTREWRRTAGGLPPVARGPHRGPHPPPGERLYERSARHRVDILCWREGVEWVFGCEIAVDTGDALPVSVVQRNAKLQPDTQHENRWTLETLEDEIILDTTDDMPITIPLRAEGQFLVFRLTEHLSKRGAQGRRVPRMTSGTYLVVVPAGWTVADEDAAMIVVGPEPTRCPGHCVYIIACDREEHRSVAFRTSAGQQARISSRQQQFILEGTRIPDFTPDRGPLFVGNFPRIRATSPGAWDHLRRIVVGFERGEAARWQIAYSPEPGEVIELPLGLQNQAGGWFFLRFYDSNGELLESTDFRFLRTLHGVEVPHVPPFPGEDGHSPCSICITHEPGTCFELRTRQLTCDRITQTDSSWTLLVPRDPNEDEVSLIVRCGPDVAVPLTLRVERIWWGDGTETRQPFQWCDHPFSLQRSDLTATTPRALWIRLPTDRWAKMIRVGFAEGDLRTCYPLATTRECCVPLRNLSGAACREEIGRHPLIVRVERDGEWYEGTPATLRVAATCPYCEYIADSLGAISRHLESAHFDKLLRQLTYSEIAQQFPDLRLPRRIYQCLYCPQIVPDDYYGSPTSAITNHIERECPNVDHGGPVKVRFRFVEDLDEIRAAVEADFVARLQDVHVCTLCHEKLIGANRAELARHLRRHLDREGGMAGQLYSLV